MKAIVYTKYGPPEVLHIEELETPVPNDDEVLVRVHAASVTLFDCWMRSCTGPPGFGLLVRIANGITGPKQPILGTDFSGVVESVGQAVTRYRPGDQVIGYTGMHMGATAECLCLPEDAVMTRMPANTSYVEGTSFQQGALTALHFLRKGEIESAQKVLVIGASGGVGSAAVQLAKHYGAEVTGVCSTKKLELVQSLGADKVIDYTEEDYFATDERFDIIFDSMGKSSILRGRKFLTDSGTYLYATFGLPKLLQIAWCSLARTPKMYVGTLEERTEDLELLVELIETGQYQLIVDSSYPMEQAAEAHRRVESGKKTGSVVINLVADTL